VAKSIGPFTCVVVSDILSNDHQVKVRSSVLLESLLLRSRATAAAWLPSFTAIGCPFCDIEAHGGGEKEFRQVAEMIARNLLRWGEEWNRRPHEFAC